MNFAAVFEAVARRQPDATALADLNGPVQSYGAVLAEAASLAGALRDRFGLAPGDRVAIFMENHLRFYPLLFALWRAGLAAVPINAKLHAKEVQWICDNADAKLLVVSGKSGSGLSDSASQAWPTTISVDDPAFAKLAQHPPAAQHDGATTDEAWLFYTSGTTGRPKGARLSHRSLLFMCHAYYADIDSLDWRDTMLHAAPLTHGSGLYGLANALRGGTNLILSEFEPNDVFDAIARFTNVSFFAAPTMVTRLVKAHDGRARDLTHLKTISYGGAPMYVADLTRALETFGARLYQLYGQGESPMTITGLPKALHAGTDKTEVVKRLATTGFARTGVAVKIARADGKDAEPDEVGEIITKSDALMLGYWNNPDANAKALQGGWLWTGDLGSIDAQGYLTIMDRSKDMIISGGSNIYPREIEEVLLTHPDVAECAVTGVPHPDWGEEVVAFIVRSAPVPADSHAHVTSTSPGSGPGTGSGPGSGCGAYEAELDRLCLDNIARFKRPKRYLFIESLPKNNYGKILKTELRKLL